jgi:hypothetical protein
MTSDLTSISHPRVLLDIVGFPAADFEGFTTGKLNILELCNGKADF